MKKKLEYYQSTCSTRTPFIVFLSYLLYTGEKASKMEGNFIIRIDFLEHTTSIRNFPKRKQLKYLSVLQKKMIQERETKS